MSTRLSIFSVPSRLCLGGVKIFPSLDMRTEVSRITRVVNGGKAQDFGARAEQRIYFAAKT